MKVAFVTDTHFGYRRFEADAHRQGRDAILSAAREADALILGGDNFDTSLPRMETLAEVTTILSEALAIFRSRGISGVPIYAIHGNHDRRARGFVHPTELLAQAGLLVNFHNRTLLHERGGEKIAISGMGSVPEDYAKAAISQIACKPLPGAFNIFVLHQSFQEFDVSGNDTFITFDDLPGGFDLYLCGHVHQPALTGKVLNPGSTVVTQMRKDEVGQRGWLLYDTAARKGEFKPVDSRQLFYSILAFDVAKPDDIRAAVEKEASRLAATAPKGGPEPLIKIVVKGTLAKGLGTADLSLPHLGDNIFVENGMNSENLRERIAQIKLSREKKLSARQQGMEILRKKLEGAHFTLGDPEQVFEALLEGNGKFLAEIKEKIEKTS
ncbi:MAG: metallophosphoesterase [Candidatus Micrarchaeota archaeon]|nr:metallophosphoesterase [Candidatus Micrarchaeota archaeon]